MYRIYAKLPGEKRFYAISGHGTTKKLIYAEMWEDLDSATKAYNSLTAINDDIQFEIRGA